MASLPLSLSKTLAYFDKYNYPLTASELWFWQHGSKIAKSKILSLSNGLEIRNWQLRRQRSKFSQAKWKIAKKVGKSLKSFPTVAAVYVTGALAMNNCPKDDDIDLMIVTYPNTLWITRFFVNLYLWRIRRFPGQTSAPDKICPNLWLDTKNLKLKTKNLRVAHEILQAKVLWDRAHIHSQFLRANFWVKSYLPVAYSELIKNLDLITREARRSRYCKLKIGNFVLWLLNILFFWPQYVYMFPKMTSEKIGLGFAFFHPPSLHDIFSPWQKKMSGKDFEGARGSKLKKRWKAQTPLPTASN